MKQRKKLLNLSFVLTLTLGLTGCFDLGFDNDEKDRGIKERNYEEYYKTIYDSIGTIKLYGQDESSDSYDLKDDFFNDKTVKEMEVNVDFDEYLLMTVEIKKDFTLDALSMYVKASEDLEQEKKLDICLYYFSDDSFDDLCPYDEEEIYKKDSKGEDYLYDLNGNKIYKDFDLPPKSKAMATATTKVAGSKWNSFTFSTFNGEKTLDVKEGNYIGIGFYNNTGYQKAINNETKDESLKREKVSIACTNLLIRGK